jgi:hypothetical protein
MTLIPSHGYPDNAIKTNRFGYLLNGSAGIFMYSARKKDESFKNYDHSPYLGRPVERLC